MKLAWRSPGSDGGRDRDRVLIRTLVTGAGVQAAQVTSTVISLPFAARSLTDQEFGVFAAFTGFVALLGFADLGVGAALTGRMATSAGARDVAVVRRIIGSALVAVSASAAVVVAIGTATAMLLPWRDILGAGDVSANSLTAAAIAAVAATALAVVSSLGQRILYGLQRAHEANLWLAGATVVGAAGVIVSALMDLPLYSYVLGGLAGPGLVALVCTSTVIRGVTGDRLWSVWRNVDRHELAKSVMPSTWFFIIAVSATIAYQTDTLVVAGVLGAAAAGAYSVVARVFGLLVQAIYPMMVQLWPAFTDALEKGDADWVVSRFRRASVFGLVAGGLASGLLVVIARPLIGLWLTPSLVPPIGLLLAAGVWATYSLTVAPIFFFLNAAGRVRSHAVMAGLVPVVNLPTSIVLAQQVGIEGPLVASLLSHMAVAGAPGAILSRRLLRDLRHKSA